MNLDLEQFDVSEEIHGTYSMKCDAVEQVANLLEYAKQLKAQLDVAIGTLKEIQHSDELAQHFAEEALAKIKELEKS